MCLGPQDEGNGRPQPSIHFLAPTLAFGEHLLSELIIAIAALPKCTPARVSQFANVFLRFFVTNSTAPTPVIGIECQL